jgi:pSer/pThr/pTyr-binding forkhead associated (FHA) protein
VLADDSFVSTVHARVFRRDGAVYIEDLGSRNGTLLNGEPLVHAAQLRRGDQVQFGQTVAEAVR